MAHDEKKLPKWAQDRIETLRRDVARWQGIAYDVAESEAGTRIEIDPSVMRLRAERQFIPEGSTIRFYFHTPEEDKRWEGDHRHYIDISLESGSLVCRSKRGVAVRPYSSNMLFLRPEDFGGR